MGFQLWLNEGYVLEWQIGKGRVFLLLVVEIDRPDSLLYLAACTWYIVPSDENNVWKQQDELRTQICKTGIVGYKKKKKRHRGDRHQCELHSDLSLTGSGLHKYTAFWGLQYQWTTLQVCRVKSDVHINDINPVLRLQTQFMESSWFWAFIYAFFAFYFFIFKLTL